MEFQRNTGIVTTAVIIVISFVTFSDTFVLLKTNGVVSKHLSRHLSIVRKHPRKHPSSNNIITLSLASENFKSNSLQTNYVDDIETTDECRTLTYLQELNPGFGVQKLNLGLGAQYSNPGLGVQELNPVLGVRLEPKAALSRSMANVDVDPQDNNSLYGSLTCPNNLLDLYHTTGGLNEVSVCPWKNVVNVNEYRYPVVMIYAQCACPLCIKTDSNGFDKTSGTTCRPVFRKVKVLQRCQSSSAVNRYRQMYEQVPVACACSRPHVTT